MYELVEIIHGLQTKRYSVNQSTILEWRCLLLVLVLPCYLCGMGVFTTGGHNCHKKESSRKNKLPISIVSNKNNEQLQSMVLPFALILLSCFPLMNMTTEHLQENENVKQGEVSDVAEGNMYLKGTTWLGLLKGTTWLGLLKGTTWLGLLKGTTLLGFNLLGGLDLLRRQPST